MRSDHSGCPVLVGVESERTLQVTEFEFLVCNLWSDGLRGYQSKTPKDIQREFLYSGRNPIPVRDK